MSNNISGGCGIRTHIGVTLDCLANSSNDHYGNPPMGRAGFEPAWARPTPRQARSPLARSGNDPWRWRQESNPLGYRPTLFKSASHRWALHQPQYTTLCIVCNTCINEYNVKTIKVLTTINQYDTMMLRKESTNDRNGRITHRQRCGPYPQVHPILHQDVVQKWRIEGASDRWTLEDQTRGPARLCRKAVSSRNRAEINKATFWWQWTTNKLTVAGQFLTDWNPRRNALRRRYPNLSIGDSDKHCQELPKTIPKIWVCVESVCVSMNNNPKYKAIETIHSGYRFRSRLEARWSIFLETLGIEYRYEPEGFELPDGTWYLPDFYLPQFEIWVEIKPDIPTTKEREKAIQLCIATQNAVALFAGDVWHDVKGFTFSPINNFANDKIFMNNILNIFAGIDICWLSTSECIIADGSFIAGINTERGFCWSRADWGQCSECNSIIITGFGPARLSSCPCEGPTGFENGNEAPDLLKAYTAARQARF